MYFKTMFLDAYTFQIVMSSWLVDSFIIMSFSLFFFKIYLFIYLFLAVLGLCFCARAVSSCGERGPLFIALGGPLTVAASPVAERRLSSCGSRP